jgi:hypothetical protein
VEIIHLLEKGPRPVKKLLKELDVLDQNQLDIDDLWWEEILGKSGFTPTDILHIDGRHTPWDEDASQAALTVFCNYLTMPKEELMHLVWSDITRKIVSAVVHFLTDKDIPGDDAEEGDLGQWFLSNSLFPNHPHLETEIHLQHPIVGIGAPAQVMLQDAADTLNTQLILPDHYYVANTAGAVAGSVMVTKEVLIYPHLSQDKVDVIGYYVQSREEREEREGLEEALQTGKRRGEEKARNAALRSGADNPQVVIDVNQEGMDTYRVIARAVGKPRLEV